MTDFLIALPLISNVSLPVYWQRASEEGIMPYLRVVLLPGGSQKPLIWRQREEFDQSLDLILSTPDEVAGLLFMQDLSKALSNFRGDMTPAEDVFIRCRPIYCLDGSTTKFNFYLPLRVKYLADT